MLEKMSLCKEIRYIPITDTRRLSKDKVTHYACYRKITRIQQAEKNTMQSKKAHSTLYNKGEL